MRQHGGMDQGLVVDVFIPLGGLGLAVQHQAAAKEVRLEDLYVLVGGPPGIDDIPYLQHRQQVGEDSLKVPFAG